jgi:hypothetical protein
VLTHSVDKSAGLGGGKRLLKQGDAMDFSDMSVDRRLPGEIHQGPVLYGECLGAALKKNDVLRLSR